MHSLKRLINIKVILVALSLYFLCCYIIIALKRLGYPFELQWMEGSILENVNRVMQGKPIYSAPTMEFVPYLYMPLYYYITALFAKVLGLGFLSIRLVSFISSIFCMIVIFSFIYSETRNRIAAITGIGIFAASYHFCSEYFDVGRIDMLFLLFLLSGISTLKHSKSLPAIITSSLFFVLAFFTKQTALIVVLIMCIYLFVFKKSHQFLFALIFLIFAITGCLLLNHYTNGWFYYYVFGLSSRHILDLRGFLVFLGMSSFYFISIISIRLLFKNNPQKSYYYIAILAAFGSLTLGAMVNALFDLNLFIPMAAIMSIIFGIGTDLFIKRYSGIELKSPDKPFWRNRSKLMYLLLISQFLIMLYNPLKYIPDSKDIEAGNDLVQKIREMPGKVYIPAHPYLCNTPGKDKYTHILPLYDLIALQRKTNRSDSVNAIEQEFLNAISKQDFDYIILDNFNRLGPLEPMIEKYYQKQEHIFTDKTVFWTFSGAKRRPEYIYVRKNIDTH